MMKLFEKKITALQPGLQWSIRAMLLITSVQAVLAQPNATGNSSVPIPPPLDHPLRPLGITIFVVLGLLILGAAAHGIYGCCKSDPATQPLLAASK